MIKRLFPKVIVLVSGGLDSALALALMREQKIEVVPVTFPFPFALSKIKIPQVLSLPLGKDYLKILRHPKHGYGQGINPCIDCKIYMFKKAKALMRKEKADFIVTGEVLGQRPMSQHLRALLTIEKEAGLAGLVLRPLSAKVLPPTRPEEKGLVDRNKLWGIQGRSRKEQLQLAEKYGLRDYSAPAGGCFLTGREFARKLRDLFEHKKKLTWEDLFLLRIGRHFRFGDSKIIVGRNEEENGQLRRYKKKSDYVLEVEKWMGPVALLQGKKTKAAVSFAGSLTLAYSDCPEPEAVLICNSKSIKVKPIDKEQAGRYNLVNM